jgi:alpha-ribazole phosphatase/probable phosphoglycerate mutase
MTTHMITTIDLIRHGEPVGGSKYRGQSDDPLSEKGWRQMREAVGDAPPWDALITSPLSRCAEFARELAERHGLPLHSDPRFMEVGFGEWEGRDRAELAAEQPGAMERFRADPVAHRPPGAEPLDQFRDRVAGAFDEVAAAHAGRHLLIVAHAGVIRMVVRRVLDVPLAKVSRLQVPNAGITRVRVEVRDGELLPQLVFHAGTL